MVSWDLLQQLHQMIQTRRIGDGIALLSEHLGEFEELAPGESFAGSAIGCLAQWVDLGFEDSGLLNRLFARFPKSSRESLPLLDYIHLRMAEGFAAMRREELSEALRHLQAVLTLSEDLDDPKIASVVPLWRARCLRKAGEYDQALEIARHGIGTASKLNLPYVAAVIRTLESWLLFQRGESKEAARILQEAETVLRETDDFITLGNIQSAYGRMALREGRYSHALQYFEASIDLFRRRPSLEAYLARSLTNMAQAKRFLALQLRRNMDASWERRVRNGAAGLDGSSNAKDKARRLERMHELLREAQADLAQADSIYKRKSNHHGAGNVDVSLAQIYLDLEELDKAEEKATEAFELAATKADYLLMCRARIIQAMVANARFEEQVEDGEDPSRFAQLAHECAREAIAYGERTESRRLLAQAHICNGLTLVNGFFNDTEAARACCDRAESYLGHDRHDALWHELESLRARILHTGIEDPNLRAWSEGAVGDKSLQEVVGEFEELLIRRVWEHEGCKVSRVAQRLAVSPKKVRRVLRHLGLLASTAEE